MRNWWEIVLPPKRPFSIKQHLALNKPKIGSQPARSKMKYLKTISLKKKGDLQKLHVFPECGKSVKKAIASNATWGWNYAVHYFHVSQLAAERWHENKVKRPKKNDKKWNMRFVQFYCHQDRNIADKICTRKTITDFSAIINVGRLHKSCKETCHSICSEKVCKYWQGFTATLAFYTAVGFGRPEVSFGGFQF